MHKQSFGGVFKNFANFTEKHLCQSVFLIKWLALGLQFIKKETPAQVFSCKFREIYNNTFFYRTPPDNCFCTWHKQYLITTQQYFRNCKILNLRYYQTFDTAQSLTFDTGNSKSSGYLNPFLKIREFLFQLVIGIQVLQMAVLRVEPQESNACVQKN